MLENLNSISAKTLKIPIFQSKISNSFPIAELSNFDLVKTIFSTMIPFLFVFFHGEWEKGETSFHKPMQKELDPLVTPYSGSALRVPYPVCECTPHAAPFWDPCKVDFPLTYCEEIKVKVFKQL